jgi:hypothetical protein
MVGGRRTFHVPLTLILPTCHREEASAGNPQRYKTKSAKRVAQVMAGGSERALAALNPLARIKLLSTSRKDQALVAALDPHQELRPSTNTLRSHGRALLALCRNAKSIYMYVGVVVTTTDYCVLSLIPIYIYIYRVRSSRLESENSS